MPAKIQTKWKVEFDRRGPFLKSAPEVQRVEGTASQAIRGLATGLSSIGPIVTGQAEAIVREYTEEHNRQARELAPRDSGYLDSQFDTEYESSKSSLTGVSLNRARYAIFQELGFTHWRNGRWVNAQPFMFPVYGRLRQGFIKAIKGIFG